MSTPLTGPQAAWGQGLAQGVKAALQRLNAQGGVEGRPVELLLLDDGGQPARTLANTRELLAQGVLALTGYQGSAGVEAALPVLDTAGVPMVGVASSAESLREPARRWLFNLRAGAADETAALIYQLDTVGITQVAVLGQADGLGQGAMTGVRLELVRIAVRPVALETLPAAAGPAVLEAAVRKVCAAQPAALLLALPPTTALAALRAAQAQGCRPQFQVLSETGGDLARLGASPAETAGLVVAQVLPSPKGQHALAQEARAAMGADALLGYAPLEGYLGGRVLAEALRLCGRKASAACITSQLEQGRVPEVAGYRLQFGPDNRRGSRFVELTILDSQGRLRR